jgi:hypothetical protein
MNVRTETFLQGLGLLGIAYLNYKLYFYPEDLATLLAIVLSPIGFACVVMGILSIYAALAPKSKKRRGPGSNDFFGGNGTLDGR